MAKIFLAHANQDKPRVRKLYADLKTRGFDPWLDEIDLVPGQIWKVEIPKAIRQAQIFLACLSSQSVEKVGYVQNEFRLALSALGARPSGTVFLIPVRFDECDVPDLQIPDLGLSLRDIHWVDLWQEGGFDRLVQAIKIGLDKPNEAQKPGPAENVALSLGGALDQAPAYRSDQEVSPPPETKPVKPAPEGEPTLGGERPDSQPTRAMSLRDVDEAWCPQLVILPTGNFMMGSTEPERRWAIQQGCRGEWVDWEKPQHRVAIAARFAIGKYQVTRGQFARFVEATGHDMSGDASADWCSPGFEQTDQHPVVCVSWQDSQAYARWLSKETGQPYRLPSEAEWEYACRAGTTTRCSWGDDPPTPEQANFGMNIRRTSEVGAYPANPWGLYDMHGNVWEWVEDCWNDNYEGQDRPNDGSAWTSGDCTRRVLRGGSWYINPGNLRSAFRSRNKTDFRGSFIGFRVATTLSRSESVTP
jgi:formylglycine-generating enzyme required for sulfatase activity